MAVILDGLRTLARATTCAILLVHHTRKAPAGGVAGHGLRGSSDLHAFGDTNLYLRRLGADATLELRHRTSRRAVPCPVAPAPPGRRRWRLSPRTLLLRDAGPPDPLREQHARPRPGATAPLATSALRAALDVRNQTLLAVLHALATDGLIRRAGRKGWTGKTAPAPIPPLWVEPEHSLAMTGPGGCPPTAPPNSPGHPKPGRLPPPPPAPPTFLGPGMRYR